MVYAKGTAGLYEIEPSMRWNPAVVAGVGMIQDPRPLYDDMHAYLAQSGVPRTRRTPGLGKRQVPCRTDMLLRWTCMVTASDASLYVVSGYCTAAVQQTVNTREQRWLLLCTFALMYMSMPCRGWCTMLSTKPWLAGAGITGVKVDCQAGVGMMGSRCGGGPLLAASFHAALEESIARHFPGNHCINCMAHSTENIYRCPPFVPRPDEFACMLRHSSRYLQTMPRMSCQEPLSVDLALYNAFRLHVFRTVPLVATVSRPACHALSSGGPRQRWRGRPTTFTRATRRRSSRTSAPAPTSASSCQRLCSPTGTCSRGAPAL